MNNPINNIKITSKRQRHNHVLALYSIQPVDITYIIISQLYSRLGAGPISTGGPIPPPNLLAGLADRNPSTRKGL